MDASCFLTMNEILEKTDTLEARSASSHSVPQLHPLYSEFKHLSKVSRFAPLTARPFEVEEKSSSPPIPHLLYLYAVLIFIVY